MWNISRNFSWNICLQRDVWNMMKINELWRNMGGSQQLIITPRFSSLKQTPSSLPCNHFPMLHRHNFQFWNKTSTCSQLNTEIDQFYTGILMHSDACARKKYDLPPRNKYNLPQIWWDSALELELRFPLKWNMETSRNKYDSTFPQTWWSESAILQRFWTFPDTLWRKKHPETHPEVNSDAWEGWSVVSYMFGAQ